MVKQRPSSITNYKRINVSQLRQLSYQVQPMLLYMWSGLLLAGSFIAAPAKFQAPSLTDSIALEVGRAQFFWLGIAEFVFCSLLIITVVFSSRLIRVLSAVIISLFVVQQFVLMPPLDARAMLVIAGISPSKSYLHLIYIFIECIKLILLIVAGKFSVDKR